MVEEVIRKQFGLQVAVSLKPEDAARLLEIARDRQVSRSAVARQILSDWLREHPRNALGQVRKREAY